MHKKLLGLLGLHPKIKEVARINDKMETILKKGDKVIKRIR